MSSLHDGQTTEEVLTETEVEASACGIAPAVAESRCSTSAALHVPATSERIADRESRFESRAEDIPSQFSHQSQVQHDHEPETLTCSNAPLDESRSDRWIRAPSTFQQAGFPHRSRVGARFRGGRDFHKPRAQFQEVWSRVQLTPEEQQICDDVSQAMKMYREDKQRQADAEWERKRNVPLIGFMVEHKRDESLDPSLTHVKLHDHTSQASTGQGGERCYSSRAGSYDSTWTETKTAVSQELTNDTTLDISSDSRIKGAREVTEQNQTIQQLQATVMDLRMAVGELSTNLQVFVETLRSISSSSHSRVATRPAEKIVEAELDLLI